MNFRRLSVAFALLALIWLSVGPSAYGQATVSTGSIQGNITDPQGAAVAGAKVTISNKDTGRTLTTSVTSTGAYSSGALSAGTWVVRVESAGFQTTEVPIVVEVGVTATGNVTLAVGASSTVIEVTGTQVAVNTDESKVQGVLTADQIENLPINGRNFLDLAQLEPGVQIQDGGNFDPTKIGFSSISFGGRFGRTARISVDGLDVSDENVGTTTTSIPASSIAEFQLAESSLDLSNDLSGSGAVNVVTKSGSNAFHGQGYGAFRDSSVAAGFPGGTTFQRDQYGGSLGGPIFKDKLFFFVDGERTLLHESSGVVVGAPFADLTGKVQTPFHEGEELGKIDWQATKSLHVFGRFNYFQNLDDGTFGGSSTFSPYSNKDRTKAFVGGADFNTGAYTHSFRVEYLKFVNNITDSVIGSNLLFADLGVATDFVNSSLDTGASFLAPQQTIQSDRQVKYDGSRVLGSHVIRYGVDYNRIMGWTFASFFGIQPLVENFGGTGALDLTCPNGDTGVNCPLNYTPDVLLIGNGQGSFTELKRFGKQSGGLGPDNRFGIYLGDSWKIRRNLTLSAGLRYDRDTGRTDNDLAPIAAINNLFPGLGNTVRQPNLNFAPQFGFAWDPMSNGKTVIRGGIGLYFDNTVFNDILFDRLLKIPNGAFNVVQAGCSSGTPFPLAIPGGQTIIGGSAAAGGVVCSTAIGDTLPSTAGNCAGMTGAACIGAFQSSVEAAYSADPTGPNGSFVPSLIAEGAPISAGLLAPSYQSPRSLQMNIGVQHEIRPGTVLTVDYVRNVGTHYLLGIDVNHQGDARFLNTAAAENAISATNASVGCGTGFGAASIDCAISRGATITSYAANGLDSTADHGGGACPTCAFAGINPAVGTLPFYEPIGRSVYNGMDIKLVHNTRHPFRGVKYLNFQATYTLSKITNWGSGGTSGGSNISNGDQDFVNPSLDNADPGKYNGWSSLDRTHQVNFGGYADLPAGFRMGIISHFWSPLAQTPFVFGTAGTGEIFATDFAGDGTLGDPLPKSVSSSGVFNEYSVGSFSRTLSGNGLQAAIANYNNTIAGQTITPAGQALVAANLFTKAQLISLGATPPAIGAPADAGPYGELGWLKGFDADVSWAHKFWNERLELRPSVSFFNLFNFSNFTSPANAPSGNLLGGGSNINDLSPHGRTDRIGAGSGVFSFGAPRVLEFGLKLNF
jgi:hypothetical protein